MKEYIKVTAVYTSGATNEAGFMLPDGQLIFGTSIYTHFDEYLEINGDCKLHIASDEVQAIVDTNRRLTKYDNSN